MLLLTVYLTGMSHYLGHLSYICSLVFVSKPPGRNQDPSKKYIYQKVLLSLDGELGHTDKRRDLQNKGTDTFTLQSSRVYSSDLGT